MEDDRFEANNEPEKPKGLNEEVSTKEAFKVITIVFIAVAILAYFKLGGNSPSPANNPTQSKDSPPAAYVAPSPEIPKEDYIRSARQIGGKKASIYVKDFMKNADRFKGERVKINVKVMDIKEEHGQSLMNVYMTGNYEVGVVLYPGSIDVYDGDVITVYGEVYGNMEGTNRMGAQLTWPAIQAKYIKKVKTEEE